MSNKPIPQEYFAKIIEAARYAPTAGNADNVGFTVVSSKEKLKELSDFTIDTYQKVIDKLNNPLAKPFIKLFKPEYYAVVPKLGKVISEYKEGNDKVLRQATSVILFHTKTNSPTTDKFSTAHTNMAYQNASLMAESLGVAQFYLGFLCMAVFLRKGELERELGIDGSISAAMALGMPSQGFKNIVEKEVPKFKIL